MALVALIIVLTSLCFASASSSGPYSQEGVAGAVRGTAISELKIQKFKSILKDKVQQPATEIAVADLAEWESIVGASYTWSDITSSHVANTPKNDPENLKNNDGPLGAVCSQRCRQCASGCPIICCTLGGTIISIRPNPQTTSNDDDTSSSRLPSKGGQPHPLQCPCRCDRSCPQWIRDICCFTPGASDPDPDPDPDQGNGGETARVANPPASASKQSILGLVSDALNWKPNVCPCHCEEDCPAYIRAVCCAKADKPGSTTGKATLALVTGTAKGEPVSISSQINTTVSDSYITMDMVSALGLADRITRDEASGIFEIVLTVVAGPKGGKKAYNQSFRVIDGSRLAEKEQVLLGLAFMNRIGAVEIKNEFFTGPEAGLPVLSGTRDEDGANRAAGDERKDEL